MSAAIARDGESIVVTCVGSAESNASDALVAMLDRVHTDAIVPPVHEVVIDFFGLEFASASCLKVFVTWLRRVAELDGDERYQVVFRSNPDHTWQRRSLAALAAFASNVVEIR